MDRLWAPWRIGYVGKSNKEKGCFLCNAAKSPRSDAKNFVVLRGEHCFAILNRFPYNNGHVMIAPKAHKADLTEMTAEERAEMLDMILQIEGALRATMRPQGINIGFNIGAAAGAGLPGHIHAHIVPRWMGDTNFVSTLADFKVISQSLKEAHKLLTRYFAKGKKKK